MIRLQIVDGQGRLTPFGAAASGSQYLMPLDLLVPVLIASPGCRHAVVACTSVLAAVRALETFDFVADTMGDVFSLCGMLASEYSAPTVPVARTVMAAKAFHRYLCKCLHLSPIAPNLDACTRQRAWEIFRDVRTRIYDGLLVADRTDSGLQWVWSDSMRVRRI